jgi:hypothetical protein
VLTTLFLPKGIVGLFGEWRPRRRNGGSPTLVAPAPSAQPAE